LAITACRPATSQSHVGRLDEVGARGAQALEHAAAGEDEELVARHAVEVGRERRHADPVRSAVEASDAQAARGELAGAHLGVRGIERVVEDPEVAVGAREEQLLVGPSDRRGHGADEGR
jgi:hypothetical protein